MKSDIIFYLATLNKKRKTFLFLGTICIRTVNVLLIFLLEILSCAAFWGYEKQVGKRS